MNKEPKYLTENAKEGDIYYFVLDNRYYFLKIIKIIAGEEFFRYDIAVFEKTYSKLPESKDEEDFVNIYQIKYKPKKTLLYITCEYKTRELKIDEFDMSYECREKYDFHYWSNEKEKNEYNPKIILDDASIAGWTEDENGILVRSTSARIGYIFGRIEDDLKHKNKKLQKASPEYFPQWKDEIDAEIIIKMEKIFHRYLDGCSKNGVEKSLKKCLKSINKLDESEHFIGTIEAEDIFNKIFETTKPFQIEESAIEKIIEENREW